MSGIDQKEAVTVEELDVVTGGTGELGGEGGVRRIKRPCPSSTCKGVERDFSIYSGGRAVCSVCHETIFI